MLEKNLGDGFLLEKNKVYSQIRNKALALGFQFDSSPNESYWALPLSQLEEFIELKKIPFVNNVFVLKEIEKKIPGVSQWDDVTDNLKRNHTFHEACHVIARSVSKKHFGQFSQQQFKKAGSSEEKILQLMIEESFANTCELIGIIEVDDAVHKLFYEINSYIFMYEDKSNLKNFFHEFGKKNAFTFLLLSYLHANYIHPKFEDKSLDNVLKIMFEKTGQLSAVKADAKKMKIFRAISRICFELNPRFRMVTSVFYLRLLGFSISKEELPRIDFMKIISNQAVYRDFINELIAIVVTE